MQKPLEVWAKVTLGSLGGRLIKITLKKKFTADFIEKNFHC
jgi:hypothetical protein